MRGALSAGGGTVALHPRRDFDTRRRRYERDGAGDDIGRHGRLPPALVRPGVTRLGWVGTGVMGRSMVGRLRDAGFDILLTTRSRSKAEPLLERGCRWADSPAAVAAEADVVFVMVGHPADVRATILGGEGVLAGARPGTILVDHTTSSPGLAEEIEAAAARGACGASTARCRGATRAPARGR